MKRADYAVYRGDTFIDLGTKEYLAQRLNVKASTIQFFSKPAFKKRLKNKYKDNLVVIRIEDDDE